MTFLREIATDVQLFLELSVFVMILVIYVLFWGLQYLIKESYIHIPDLT